MSEEVVFDDDVLRVDRAALFAQAANLLDARLGYLSSQGGPSVESEEGATLRDLQTDHAGLAGFPEVYEIVDRDFIERQLYVPARFTELSRDYRFYSLYFPVLLQPKRNWGFNRLELSVEFNPAAKKASVRPKAYQIFPDRKFQKLFEMHDHLNVGLDENFEFKAEAAASTAALPGGDVTAAAGLKGTAVGGLGVVVGPFAYTVTRAKIEHTATGLEQVMWRLDGKEFFQENVPKLVVIVKVPRAVHRVDVRARMAAYRFFNLGSAGLWQAINELPAAIRDFFRKGAPIPDSDLYRNVTAKPGTS